MSGATQITYSTNPAPNTVKARLEYLLNPSNSVNLADSQIQTEALAAINYLQTKVNTNPGTSLQINNENLFQIKKDIIQAKEDLKVAEDRVKSLRSPESTKSYYDSWFPLNRPLRTTTVVVALAFGIFFIVLTLFTLFSSFGLQINMNVPWLSNPATAAKLNVLFPRVAVFIFGTALILGAVAWLRKA